MFPMITVSGATLSVLALLLLFLYIWVNKKDSRYPKGPRPLPLLGNVLQLGTDPRIPLQNWANKYGPVYSIKMGSENTVVISDPKLLKELFSHANSTGRPFNPILAVLGKNTGIIQAQGHVWEAQRKFTTRKLRDIGVLNSSFGEFLLEESSTLINFFERNIGKPIPAIGLFNGPVVSALWKIVSGETNNWDSPIKPEILRGAENFTRTVNRAACSGLMFAPFLRYIAPTIFGWTDWVNAVKNFYELTNVSIENHALKLDTENPEDFMDHYLIEMRKTTDPSSAFNKENGEQNLRAVALDLFLAGSETSSTSLSFAMLYLLLNKDAQKRAQREIDQVVGPWSQISLSNKASLPYTEAIVLETLRISSIISIGVPHRMLADTVFHGHFLPKDVTIISNFHAIHHDPKIWGVDADSFRPERFLSEDETRVISNDALMPFSTGRRQCIGDSLAKDTMFLFVANILQKFSIEQDPENPVFNVETTFGMVVQPKPFNFVVKLRNGENC